MGQRLCDTLYKKAYVGHKLKVPLKASSSKDCSENNKEIIILGDNVLIWEITPASL